MTLLSKAIMEELESKGLVLFGKERDRVMICKPITTVGNGIEGKIFTPIKEMELVDGTLVFKEPPFKTDAPMLAIFREENQWIVSVWQWVPGPGPGDFEITVKSEKEACELAIHYFFEDNRYFSAYKNYLLQENP